MSIIENLNEEIKSWDKMEGAGSIYFMYGWGKFQKKQNEEPESKSEEDETEYRDKTHGDRNAKHLSKARFYANTPKARLKRDRTELKKELNG